MDDFLATLAQLNRELNGPVPSEAGGGSEEIPRGAAYAVAEVIRMLRLAAKSATGAAAREQVLDAAWSVETAWRAVLAGDIDELHEHIAEERAARS